MTIEGLEDEKAGDPESPLPRRPTPDFEFNGHEMEMSPEGHRHQDPVGTLVVRDQDFRDQDSTPPMTPDPIQRPNAGGARLCRLGDTDSESDQENNPDELFDHVGQPPRWKEADVWTHSYIDDGISGEKLYNAASTHHITTRKEIRRIRSGKCEKLYKTVKKNAEMIGMKINSAKTQLLCINVARDYELCCLLYTSPSPRD